MAEAESEPDVIREPFYRLAEVKHEYDALERLAQDVQNDVTEANADVERLELERKWCFDEEGNRNRPHASEEADRIINESNNYPDLIQDVIGNLQQRKTDLQMSVSDQERKVKNSTLPDNY